MGNGAQFAEERVTYRAVFAVSEFRYLWMAQLLSVAGDQLARVALTVLVYDRTRSSVLAAVTFVAGVVPNIVGGTLLSGVADRLPRRQVMIGCDLIRLFLVLAMVVPGMPLAALIILLCAVTAISAPFTAARAATYPVILAGDRYTAPAARYTVGALIFGRSSPGRRQQLMPPLAIACCALLMPMAAKPGLDVALALLAVSGACACYQVSANARFVQAAPPHQRGQAFGLAGAGMSLGQGVAMILAGLAVQYTTAWYVVAAAGAIGAAAALALTVSRARPAPDP